MATYLLTYDLVGRNENDYPPLLKALKADSAVRILLSTWLIATTEPIGTLLRRYMNHIDTNDRLFASRVDDWAYYNIMNEAAAKRLLPA